MSDTVRIVQLYPTQLGITGDRGNVRSLEVRLTKAGVPVDVTRLGIGEALPADADIIVLGNGPLSAMRGVLDDLRLRREELEAFIAAGGSLFAIGGSAELLSTRIDLLDGEAIEGLGLFPFRVSRTRQRKVGYIIVDTPAGRIVGFEDHASQWHLDAGAERYGVVVEGQGSFDNAGAAGEIVRRGNAFATNVQGPALPLNPVWTDLILTAATAQRDIAWTPNASGSLDEYAESARSTIERLIHEKNFSTIGL